LLIVEGHAIAGRQIARNRSENGWIVQLRRDVGRARWLAHTLAGSRSGMDE